MRLKKTIPLVLMAALILSLQPRSQPAHAQGTVEDQVFVIVASNLGIFPAPTQGQLDLGSIDLPFPFRYQKDGLDLNPSGGTPTCDARVLADDELVIGWFGYRIIVTVQGRRYEFRTNGTGSSIIRCSGGQQVDNNFGAAPSRGTLRSGWDVTDQAMRHLSTYLNLSPAITRADVDRVVEARRNGETVDYPHRVFYRWDSVIFTNSALNCAAAGQEFRNGDAAGYRITLTVNGRSYQYRASPDGSVLILCLGGRADPSSQGVTIPASQ